MEINNKITTNKLQIANEFNDFFTKISAAKPIHNSLPDPNRADVSFHLHKISTKDVSEIISTLNKSAANGHDAIPMKFYILFDKELASTISSLINNAITTGIFPDCLKIAKVSPIFKSKSKLDVNNYRPISVLSSLSKIFEKAIQRQLEKFLYENGIIHPNQFGFVTMSSVLAACTQLINFVETGIDKKFIVGCVFIDISKAFDTVQHELLFKKFERIGITNKTLQLLKSYHSNRQQFTCINEVNSSKSILSAGVAQGSILSATEFSIFINDIFELKLKGKIQLYADDAVIMYHCLTSTDLINDINYDLVLIESWLTKNQLKMNVSKSNYIIFDKNKNYNNIPLVHLNNEIFERVYETKYLGLYIDSKLTWKTNVNHIVKKISSINFALYRLRYYIHKNALWNIYYAHILSHINYLTPIWSSASTSILNKLEIIQNKALRIIYGYNRLHTRAELYNKNILPLKKIIMYNLLILTFCLKNNLIKHNFEITYRHNVHNYPTRRRSHINIPSSSTNTGLTSILNRGFTSFNQLPSNIKHCQQISIFKKLLLNYIDTI